ncbi:glycoside hydrolase family 18 protein [Bacillus sinesaloumensis]|uniref:glycosyl hydrolase family 18 protein n=1 Tax=Litchfieldia sinesaloumensis TaxID=1926280 RepID=UPI0009886E2F|nr:glycoside hydrolase family 18 protein [Bacillus sinesaloumensis]
MKKRYIFLTVLIVVIFVGGFITGALLTNHNQTDQDIKIAKKSPPSSKGLEQKEMPKLSDDQSKALIGYVQDFRDPNQIDYSNLTHIIFSFVHPTKDGQVLFTGEHATQNLKKMVAKAHEQNTKVMLAVGGWFHLNGGETYDYFSAALSNQASQERLVKELVAIVERENVDGIDIDFEHPRTDDDARNLHVFIEKLSEELHSRNKEVSIAVHSKIHGQTLTELAYVKYETAMFHNVDYVNIMAYDGQWDGGYQAKNLSPYPFTESIVRYWANLFDSHKLPKEKLVLGVPFYAQPEDPNSKQLSYQTIINNNEQNAGKDVVTINGMTYHYNGQMTMLRKTELALQHGFGGMMVWELGHDATGAHSLTHTLSETISATTIKNYYTLKK